MGTLVGTSVLNTLRIVYRTCACTAILLALLLNPVLHQAASEGAESVKWTATQPRLPNGAEPNELSNLVDVACPGPGSCVAAGTYTDSEGELAPLVEVLSDGSWAPASLPLPSDAAPGGASFLGFVSCPALGSCVAVGSFTDMGGNTQGLIETLSNGRWTSAQLGLPTNAGTNPQVGIDDLACPSKTHCYVVGSYQTNQSGYHDPFIVKVSAGQSDPQQFPGPSGEIPNTFYVSSISCPSTSSCFAFGGYLTTSDDLLNVVETLAGRTWNGTIAPLPSGASAANQVQLGPVRCGGIGFCSAPGYWSPDNGATSNFMFDTLSEGDWEGSNAPLPGDAASTQPGVFPFDHISCPTSGSCMGAALYTTSTDARGWFADTLSDNSWTSTELPLPNGARADDVEVVACGGPGSCNVVAAYNTSRGKPAFRAFSLSDGAWTSTQLPLPTGGRDNDSSSLNGDVCPSATSCVAVGADRAEGQTNANVSALIETMSG